MKGVLTVFFVILGLPVLSAWLIPLIGEWQAILVIVLGCIVVFKFIWVERKRNA